MLVVDTDGGTDDAVALWWALAAPPAEVEVAAILVTGGVVSRDAAVANVLRILHAAGRSDVPVALGADSATGGPTSHGVDGLGGFADRWSTGELVPVTEPAPDLLRRLTSERPGEIDLLTIGPLSTLADAVTADPLLPERLRSFTAMAGGSTETNVALDPTAAGTVFAGASPRRVGLDVTLRRLLHDDDIELAGEGRTAAARFLADPLRAYAAANVQAGRVPDGCPVHDLVAALAAVRGAVPDEDEVRRAFRAMV